MFTLAAATAIGGALSAAAGAHGANKNTQAIRETNETNKQIAHERNEYNQRMVDKQNEYNSYANQRKRIEEGGGNPAFAMNQMAAGSATSANYAPAAEYTAQSDQRGQVGQSVAAALSTQTAQQIQAQQAQANIEATNAQRDLTLQKVNESKAIENKINGYEKENTESATYLNKANSVLTEAKTAYQNVENSLISTFGSKKAQAEIDMLVQQKLQSQSAVRKNDAEIKQLVASTIESYARSNGIQLNNNILQQTTNDVIKSVALRNTYQEYDNAIKKIDAGIKQKYAPTIAKEETSQSQIQTQTNQVTLDMLKTDKDWQQFDKITGAVGTIIGNVNQIKPTGVVQGLQKLKPQSVSQRFWGSSKSHSE